MVLSAANTGIAQARAVHCLLLIVMMLFLFGYDEELSLSRGVVSAQADLAMCSHYDIYDQIPVAQETKHGALGLYSQRRLLYWRLKALVMAPTSSISAHFSMT